MKKMICLALSALLTCAMLAGCTTAKTELWNAYQKTTEYKSCAQNMTLDISTDTSGVTDPMLASVLASINGMSVKLNTKAINDIKNGKLQTEIAIDTQYQGIPFSMKYWVDMDLSDIDTPKFKAIYEFPEVMKNLDPSAVLTKQYYYMDLADSSDLKGIDFSKGNPFDTAYLLDAISKMDTAGITVSEENGAYTVKINNDAFYSIIKQYMQVILSNPAYGALLTETPMEEITAAIDNFSKANVFGGKDISTTYTINDKGYLASSDTSLDIAVDLAVIADLFDVSDNTSTDKFNVNIKAKCEYTDYDAITAIGFPVLTDENSANMTEITTIPSDDEISVYVNGEKFYFDVAPQSVNDRTMVPMRAIFEALGAEVEYNDGVIVSVFGDKTITHTIGETVIYINEEKLEMDVPSFETGGRTLVPVRFISEALGADVLWIEESQTVMISL